MNPFSQILTAKPFVATTVAWLLAQGMKVLIYYFRHHKIDFRLFVGSGGMPSSHSAFVCCLATTLGFAAGWDSPVFLLALGVALIVMFDAASVRRAAGQQAQILNKIVDDLYKSRPIPQKRLKELLGHTPTQVFAGALLGLLVGIAFNL